MSTFKTLAQQMAAVKKSRLAWLTKIGASGLTVTEAAEQAGMPRKSLYNMLKRADIQCTKDRVYVVDKSRATPRRAKPKTPERIMQDALRKRTKELCKAGYLPQAAMVEAAREIRAKL